jgi:hypothetical protein
MAVNISSTKLRRLVTLSKRKEKLMMQIQEIDRQMLQLEHEFDRSPGTGIRKAPLSFSAESKTAGKRSRKRKGDHRKARVRARK